MPKVKAIYELKQESINPDDFYMLSRALSQPNVKLKKKKPMFTKAEIEYLIHGLNQFMFDTDYTDECRNECKKLKQKLNEQLKELI